MSSIVLNTEQWPVCFFKLEGEQSYEDYESYIQAFNRFYERKEPFCIISYIKSYRSKPELISRTGRWFKETEPLIKKYWVSNAMLSESAGFRFLLSAVFLIKPLVIPSRVCATSAEAMSFTRGELRQRGVVPSELRWPF